MINKRKSIVIQVTEDCNLHCVYCYQVHNKTFKASFETIIAIINNEFQSMDGYNEIEFDFIGGEPLIEFALIRKTCEWTWSKSFSSPYIFFATTNGTLLNEEMKEWFSKHRQKFWLGLSIDGTKQMHDKNRCGSYSLIDISFFKQNWPEQTIKMTVSPDSVYNFAEGVIELTEMGFKVAANLAYGIDWSNNDYIEVFGRELEKLANYYLKHPDIQPIMLMDMPLYKIARNEISNYCGTGIGMAAYNTSGQKFPCQMFYPTTFGNRRPWENESFRKIHNDYYSNCYEKSIFPVCPVCVGMNLKETGETHTCNTDLCNLMKVLVKANAWFIAQKLKSKTYAMNQVDVIGDVVNAIKTINTLKL